MKLPPRHDRVNRIFGLACCSLEAPLAQLAELEGSGSLDEEVEGSDTGEGPAPHPLAQALAQYRLPALEGLDTTYRGWRFFKHETNADLLEGAINLGHLPRLVRLNVERGSVPGALGEIMAPGLHQPVLPNMHRLIISGCISVTSRTSSDPMEGAQSQPPRSLHSEPQQTCQCRLRLCGRRACSA